MSNYKLLNVEWKVEECFAGPDCWCKIIVPVEPFIGKDGEEWDCVIPSGSISKEIAEHIVNLHNFYVRNKEGYPDW